MGPRFKITSRPHGRLSFSFLLGRSNEYLELWGTWRLKVNCLFVLTVHSWKGSFIYTYAKFSKKLTFPTWAYQGVRNSSFSENFACVRNGWFQTDESYSYKRAIQRNPVNSVLKILKYCIHFSVNFAIVFGPGFSQNTTRRILLQRICLVNTDISFLRVVFDKLLPELKAFHEGFIHLVYTKKISLKLTWYKKVTWYKYVHVRTYWMVTP